MVINQDALDVGGLANQLAQGYYSHVTAVSIAANPQAKKLAPEILPGNRVPVGFVNRKDGTQHEFSFLHFMNLIKSEAFISSEMERVWLAGSLLTLGDALAKHQYFQRDPILELVRHLRNGIAHGNRFRIDKPTHLVKFPAHNKDAYLKSDYETLFEITPALDGKTVLFDFMEPGDVLDVLVSVHCCLDTLGTDVNTR